MEGINNLIVQKSPKVVLLDDAFQHRKVKGSFYILLTKYDDLFTADFLLPTGNLRESRKGAKRADVIVVTKCPTEINTIEKDFIKSKLKKFNKKVFFTTISYADKISGDKEISLEDLKEFEVLLLTGIANPDPLLKFLSFQNIQYRHVKYGDHHHFSSKDVADIQQTFTNLASDKKLILTTEKDYTRLKNRLEELFYLEIETQFLENKNIFDTIIKSQIQ